MANIQIHFTDGKNVQFGSDDPEMIASVLNVNPHGTTRINNSDGTTVIVNREQMTHALITGMPT